MSYNNMSLLDADEVYAILQSRIGEIQSVVDILSSIQRYIGVTTTVLTDGATTNPILIDGESVTAVSGDAVIYNGEDFVFNGEIWQSVPDALGALAYKNSAKGEFTPAGTISVNAVVDNGDLTLASSFSGTTGTVEVS